MREFEDFSYSLRFPGVCSGFLKVPVGHQLFLRWIQCCVLNALKRFWFLGLFMCFMEWGPGALMGFSRLCRSF